MSTIVTWFFFLLVRKSLYLILAWTLFYFYWCDNFDPLGTLSFDAISPFDLRCLFFIQTFFMKLGIIVSLSTLLVIMICHILFCWHFLFNAAKFHYLYVSSLLALGVASGVYLLITVVIDLIVKFLHNAMSKRNTVLQSNYKSAFMVCSEISSRVPHSAYVPHLCLIYLYNFEH